MVSLTSPRFSSLLAIISLILFTFINFTLDDVPVQLQIFMLLLISFFIGIAAFNFAANELKDTAGISYTIELGFGKILSILLFTTLIVFGYDIFVILIVQMFNENGLQGFSDVAVYMLYLSVLFLTLYPFFQLINLAQSGEQSSLPSEFVIEKLVEKLAKRLKSPFIASSLLYITLYIIPILIIDYILNNLLLSVFLWSLLLPLISVSALAGAGIGEDLIRLRLIKNPFKDLKKLGLPKISIKNLHFEIGGLFLIIFGIQAIITTFYFGVKGLMQSFGYLEFDVGVFSVSVTLVLALVNKGRGATKEVTGVWKETGFKVSMFQLFLPIFVFLGVIISSILEVFINNPSGVLYDLGLDNHLQLISGFLAVQNFFMVFTALFIIKTVPGTAERRLIYELPEFHKLNDGNPDIKGYLFMYKKLKSEKSVENLLRVTTKMIKKDISQVTLLKDLLKETLQNPHERVQIAASETLHTVLERVEKFDQDLLELAKISLNSEFSGARIYGIRSYRALIQLSDDGIQKENLIKTIAEKLSDEDNVVSWDTGILLQKIIEEDETYKSFVLAHVFTILLETDKENTKTSINRLLTRLSSKSQNIGQMAISVLSSRLASQDVGNTDNLVLAVRSILRGNPLLAVDLIDLVSMGTLDPKTEIRKRSYVILLNLAEYSEGIDKEILNLILQGIQDENEEIQDLSYQALKGEVRNSPEHINEIFTIISSSFNDLRGVSLIGALDVLETIVSEKNGIEQEIYALIKDTIDSNNDVVREKILIIFTKLLDLEKPLAQNIYLIVEKNIYDKNEEVRQRAIYAMGKCVSAKPDLSKVVYRKINASRNDSSFKVQLSAIEALGFVASSDRSLADEIFNNLTPLLDDNNWRVRLASFNGLFAASKHRRDLQEELVNQTLVALADPDQVVREGAFDALNWLIQNFRTSSEIFVVEIQKLIKVVEEEILSVLYNSLEIIADRRSDLIEVIIPQLHRGFESLDSSCRNGALNTLNAAMGKLSRAREPSKDLHKVLNKLVTRLLQSANNSNTGVRRTAYDAMTAICVAVPSFKVAQRGRKSLKIALKSEKDVGLISLLENSIIRARPPLEFKNNR